MVGVKPRIAVMISSSAANRDDEPGALNTWLWEWGKDIEHYILLGDGNTVKNPCDWIVRCDDGYDTCAVKTWYAAKFAAENNLDYILKCDIDTYVCVPRLLAFDASGKDYIGYRCAEGHAAGGNGYLLSKFACSILAAAQPTTGYQDLWAGRVLAGAGVECEHDERFAGARVPWDNRTVTMHLGISGKKFETWRMQDCHEGYWKHVSKQN